MRSKYSFTHTVNSVFSLIFALLLIFLRSSWGTHEILGLFKMRNACFHVFCYYLVWFVCVLCAAYEKVWIGTGVAVCITLLQYGLMAVPRRKYVWSFVWVTTLFGFMIDSLFAQYDLILFRANPFQGFWAFLAPPWMMGIWFNFSLVLYFFFEKHFLKYRLFALLSLLGFPIAYLSGVGLGAAILPRGVFGLVIVGVVWAVILPAIMYVFGRLQEADYV